MTATLDSYGGTSLLHRLHSVVDLMETALRTPNRYIAVVLVAEHPLKAIEKIGKVRKALNRQ